MSFAVWWILFGIALIGEGAAWLGLWTNWRTDRQTLLITSGIVFPTASTLIACGALAYVQLGGTVASRNYRIEVSGLFLALLGTALGLAVTLRFRRWFSALALAVSVWMSAIFFLMASTI